MLRLHTHYTLYYMWMYMYMTFLTEAALTWIEFQVIQRGKINNMLESWIIHDGPLLYTIKDVLTTGCMNLKGEKPILVDIVFAKYMTLSPPINHVSPTTLIFSWLQFSSLFGLCCTLKHLSGHLPDKIKLENNWEMEIIKKGWTPVVLEHWDALRGWKLLGSLLLVLFDCQIL